MNQFTQLVFEFLFRKSDCLLLMPPGFLSLLSNRLHISQTPQPDTDVV